MSSPKRRRISHHDGVGVASASPEELEQTRRLLLGAVSQELDLAHACRLADSHAGRTERQQLAWSRHNLIAHASSVPISTSDDATAGATAASSTATRPHVVLRSLAQPGPNPSDPSQIKPCFLYPPLKAGHPDALHANGADPSASTMPPSETALPSLTKPAQYANPQGITFSPCGFYLTAYFPLASTAPGSLRQHDALLDQEAKAMQQIEASMVPPSLPSLSRNHTEVPGDALAAHVSASTAASGLLPANGIAMSLPAASPPAAHRDKETGKLCIWSRADTGALNDWTLLQTLDVVAQPKSNGATTTRGDYSAAELAEQPSDASGSVSVNQPCLHGGVKRITWLGSKRKWVQRTGDAAGDSCSSYYEREPSRGPTFLTSEESSGAQLDIALVVFGKYGQVSLLHSRGADRRQRSAPVPALATNGNPTATAIRDPAPFEILQSSLFEPALRPAPPTISSQVAGVSPSSGDALDGDANAAAVSASSAFRPRIPELAHLAVGMLADEPVLLVASSSLHRTEAGIQLCEVTIDLKGEHVTMVTRPLDSLPPISTWSSMEGSPLDSEAGLGGEAALTSLAFLEVRSAGRLAEPLKDERSASLRLLASFTVPYSIDGAAVTYDSYLKVWDLGKEIDELSDAFNSLECRKPVSPSKGTERALRLTATERLGSAIVTSVLAPQQLTLSTSNVVVASVLSAEEGEQPSDIHPRYLESMRYLDAITLEVIPTSGTQAAAVPSKAANRTASLALSPNGALAAALAHDPPGATRQKLVIWKLPPLSSPFAGTHPAAGHLLGLSMLRRTDPFDLVRAVFSPSKAHPAALLECARCLGMYRSVRSENHDRQQIKAESSPEDGPSAVTQHPSAHALLPTFPQILRMVEVHISMLSHRRPGAQLDSHRNDEVGEAQRLILDLAHLLEMVHTNRVLTPPSAQPSPGKSATSVAETRVHYRLDSIWALIAQLQWVLSVLDGLSLHALPSLQVSPTVRLLTYRTPRRLFVAVLHGLCEFKAWLFSTVRKENLPPLYEPMRAGSGTAMTEGRNLNVGVIAISEQMELAREAVRHVSVSASVDLEAALRVFSAFDRGTDGAGGVGEEGDEDEELAWWTMDGADTEAGSGDEGRKAKAEQLLRALVDEERGALVDCLTLFLRPGDLLDEKTALRPDTDKGKTERARDVVTKSIVKTGPGDSKLRRCLRCGALSRDPLRRPAVGTATDLQPSAVEERFATRCLCGGSWWSV